MKHFLTLCQHQAKYFNQNNYVHELCAESALLMLMLPTDRRKSFECGFDESDRKADLPISTNPHEKRRFRDPIVPPMVLKLQIGNTFIWNEWRNHQKPIMQGFGLLCFFNLFFLPFLLPFWKKKILFRVFETMFVIPSSLNTCLLLFLYNIQYPMLLTAKLSYDFVSHLEQKEMERKGVMHRTIANQTNQTMDILYNNRNMVQYGACHLPCGLQTILPPPTYRYVGFDVCLALRNLSMAFTGVTVTSFQYILNRSAFLTAKTFLIFNFFSFF